MNVIFLRHFSYGDLLYLVHVSQRVKL